MSGQHEWGELDRSDQPDPRDATLDLSGLIDAMSRQLRATSGNGRHHAKPGDVVAEPPAIFETALAQPLGQPLVQPDLAGGVQSQVLTPVAAEISPDIAAEPGPTAIAAPALEVDAVAGDGSAAGEAAAQASEQGPAMPLPVAAPDPRADRPAPGSLADLRQRLERLPYGHPSSPYHVDGERKPPPPRLRHLELAPPTPSRFATSFSSPVLPDLAASDPADEFRFPAAQTDRMAVGGPADTAPAEITAAEITAAEIPATAEIGTQAEVIEAAGGEPEGHAGEPGEAGTNGYHAAGPASFGAYQAPASFESITWTARAESRADLAASENTSQFPAFDGRRTEAYADSPQPTGSAGESGSAAIEADEPDRDESARGQSGPGAADHRTVNGTEFNGHFSHGTDPYHENSHRPEPSRPEPSRPEPSRPEPSRPEPSRPEPYPRDRYSPEPYSPEPYSPDRYSADRYSAEQGSLRQESGRHSARLDSVSDPSGGQLLNGQPGPSGVGREGPDRGEARRVPSPTPPASQAESGPGPRSDYDGSWTWGPARLTADQARIANEAYDRFRAAEGRNLFGNYGSTGLTSAMRQIAEVTEHASMAPDTEQYALLDPDTFKLRFADMLRRYPDRTADRLARRVPGAISYSFIFEPEHYSAGIWAVQDALTAAGFQLLARRNDWKNTTNRCVATMWHDPANDLPFQVQFHTTASLEAQQLARSSAHSSGQSSSLAAAWASLPAPPGNAEISDYRRAPGAARR